MSDAKHTPGPWQYDPRGDFDTVFAGGGLRRIADVYGSHGTDCIPENAANARLIAEAPAMLDELRSMLQDHGMTGPRWDRIRAILKRVDGEE